MSTVHIARCASYGDAEVEQAVRQSVAVLGGIQQFVKPGQKVVLKPNLLRPALPDKQISTHPTVVKAAAKLVREAGAIPIIVDSPGGPHNAAYLRVLYATTGMDAAARAAGATVNDDLRSTRVSFPQGHLLKMVDMLSVIAEADVIISLPKLKTHGLTTFTGATKNLFGAIPGVTKAGYHAKLQTPRQFSEMLIDVLNCCHPALTIMDGVIGMEGNGPSNGTPRAVGVILASADGIALDVVAAAIAGIPALDIPPLVVARDWGQTSGRVEDVQISGLSIDEARIDPPFVLPKTVRGERRQGMITRLIGKWRPTKWLVVNPYSNARCTACGACVRACPVQAISIINKRAQMDLDKCIRCYCCHELCPHDAIDLKRHWLAEWLVR